MTLSKKKATLKKDGAGKQTGQKKNRESLVNEKVEKAVEESYKKIMKTIEKSQHQSMDAMEAAQIAVKTAVEDMGKAIEEGQKAVEENLKINLKNKE